MPSALLRLLSASVVCAPNAERAKVVCRCAPCKRRRIVSTYENYIRHHAESRGYFYPLPPEKNVELTPRELQCLDRAHTSTTGSERPFFVDALNVLARNARTKRYDLNETIFLRIYVYICTGSGYPGIYATTDYILLSCSNIKYHVKLAGRENVCNLGSGLCSKRCLECWLRQPFQCEFKKGGTVSRTWKNGEEINTPD